MTKRTSRVGLLDENRNLSNHGLTRIYSASIWYHFAFIAISVAGKWSRAVELIDCGVQIAAGLAQLARLYVNVA